MTPPTDADSIAALQAEVADLRRQLAEHEEAAHRQTEELARSAAALREHGRLLELILDCMSEGVVGCDERGKLILFNPAATRIAGMRPLDQTPDEWPRKVGVYYPDGITPIPPEELSLGHALRGESIDDLHQLLRNPNLAEDVHITVTGRPLRDADGSIRGGVAVIRDVTERLRAERELRQAAAELARSNADLQEFAYTASHDLQEPLRAVTGFLQLLAQRYQGQFDEDADRYIEFALDGAARMQALIHDLLAYARLGNEGHQPRAFPSGHALDAALANLDASLQESGATVARADLPTVWADPLHLTLLFQNLVGNALKFRATAAPRIEVGAAREADGWRFAVQDNGIGIEPRHHQRIFGLFHRVHGRQEYAGTGMGLTICKRIVERHGGRIWVESTPAAGATFAFILPDPPSVG